MAFDNLSEKLQAVFKKLKNRGKLSESDIKSSMREIKLALLEADVNFVVVKDFIRKVSDKCMGSDIYASLTPGQQVIDIVRQEMTELLGGNVENIRLSNVPPTVIMMMGLQGAGKTTFCAKLAKYYIKNGKFPLLVACDIHRPAAIKQLHVVGEQVGAKVFDMGCADVVSVYKEAIKEANRLSCDIVIVDTAGRLHVDDELMSELKKLRDFANPNESLLVLDAMIGQDAVSAAKVFDEKIGFDGVVLTKIDGDARGGAAMSVRAVTGKPIKFVGTGEKLDDIELFYPDRMTSRILGMGDVLSLIDKAKDAFEEEKALNISKKISNNQFDLDDFLDQFEQLKNMGDINDVLSMIPGAKKLAGVSIDEKKMDRIAAIVKSMTPSERKHPEILNASRRKRIAAGSGTRIQDVNGVLNQFEQMKKLMKQMSGRGKRMPGFMKNMMRFS